MTFAFHSFYFVLIEWDLDINNTIMCLYLFVCIVLIHTFNLDTILAREVT